MIESTIAVAGATEVLTPEGPRRLVDAVGQTIQAWSGEGYVPVTVQNLGPREDWMVVHFRDLQGRVHSLEVLDGHGILVGDAQAAPVDCLAAKDLPAVAVVMHRRPDQSVEAWRRSGSEILDLVQDAYSIQGATPLQLNGVPSL